MTSIAGLAYRGFHWLSSALLKVLYGGNKLKLRDSLEAAGIKVFPEAYLSIVGMFLVVSIAISVVLALLTSFYPLLIVPVVVLLIGYALPSIKAQDRASKLDMETSFMAAYISVMATGGLSPYASLRRLKNCDLLPQTSKMAKDIEVNVRLKGMDPIAAMERAAERAPSKEFRDFFLGYLHSLRAGGDIVHYLLTRTETMFRDLTAKIRVFGERAAILLESYVAIMILGTLGISIIYLVSIAFQGFWYVGFTAESFMMYSYVVVPAMSALFMYLSDLSSFQEPIYEMGPYKIFLASIPLMVFLVFVMFMPYVVLELGMLPPIAFFKDFLTNLRTMLGLKRGLEPALGLGIALIVGTLPAAIAHRYYERRRGRKIIFEIANFLRDMTEARKTGASPEACILQLASRPYGALSKYLKVVARRLRWGQPVRVIYETLKRRISSWFALMNLYLMVDAIEVGGGAPETLETMAKFGEMQVSLEKERKASLRPLIIMPYIGAALMILSTLITVDFMYTAAMSIGRVAIPYVQMVTVIVPALVFQSYLMGIVTGKISNGNVSAGFEHAIILTLIAIMSIISMQFIGLIIAI